VLVDAATISCICKVRPWIGHYWLGTQIVFRISKASRAFPEIRPLAYSASFLLAVFRSSQLRINTLMLALKKLQSSQNAFSGLFQGSGLFLMLLVYLFKVFFLWCESESEITYFSTLKKIFAGVDFHMVFFNLSITKCKDSRCCSCF
jgi:hypothetical protein